MIRRCMRSSSHRDSFLHSSEFQEDREDETSLVFNTPRGLYLLHGLLKGSIADLSLHRLECRPGFEMTDKLFTVPRDFDLEFWRGDRLEFKSQRLVMSVNMLAFRLPIGREDFEIPVANDGIDWRHTVCEIIHPNRDNSPRTSNSSCLVAESRRVDPVIRLCNGYQIE